MAISDPSLFTYMVLSLLMYYTVAGNLTTLVIRGCPPPGNMSIGYDLTHYADPDRYYEVCI